MTLQTERLRTVEQIEAFLGGNAEVDFKPEGREAAYGFARRTLVRLGYASLDRPGKGAVREYLVKTTGFSRAQVTRLIAQHRETGRIEDRRGGNSGRPFARVYTPADIACWPAACEVLRREFEVFGDRRHERLSRLSASHLYNLRRT